MSLYAHLGGMGLERKKDNQNKQDINASPTELPEQLGTIWTNENQNFSSQAKPL